MTPAKPRPPVTPPRPPGPTPPGSGWTPEPRLLDEHAGNPSEREFAGIINEQQYPVEAIRDRYALAYVRVHERLARASVWPSAARAA
jgi:hypothetical protein